MGRSLEATLRARGASTPLMRELENAGMLSERAFAAVVAAAIQARPKSRRSVSNLRGGEGKPARPSRRSQATGNSAQNLELLAAIALCYL